MFTSNLAKAQVNFDVRLLEIDSKMSQLADSLLPGLNETAEFSVVNASVVDLLRGVAEAHRLNISVDPAVNARITNNFSGVQVKNLLLFLCREYRLDVRFQNTILTFYPFKELQTVKERKVQRAEIDYDADSDLLSIEFKEDSLYGFVKNLSRISGKNIIVAPEVPDKTLRGYINRVSFDQGLERLAYANALKLEKTEDGFYIIHKSSKAEEVEEKPGRTVIGRRGNGSVRAGSNASTQGLFIDPVFTERDTLLNVEASNVEIKEVIREAAALLDKDFIFFSDPAGTTFTKLDKVSFSQLLNILLHGSAHGYQYQNEVYLIGERLQEGFRTTKLYKFQFRTIKDIDKVIPAEIARGVQITPFPELNALILSGSQVRINEVEQFLKEIDQAVPNILIEVIVVDVRKGYNIRTGISGGLGDSTVVTQGQVFPGLDLTLSSSSVNKVLDRIEDAGIVNLGRVRPNFYVSLQALEENDDIKIRSTPKLATLNGHEATLSIGQSVYYVEEIQNVTGGVQPVITQSQRFNKVEANLAIKIKPVVSGDEHITLNIEAEFSDFLPPQVEKAPPGNATRRFVSDVRIKNDEMILLGGLEEARREKGSSGFPILSRIPVLKWLFSSRSKTKRDDRLVIFIRPTVVY